MRSKRMHRRVHERSSHPHGRRVLHSVLRPARVDPHYAPDGKPSRGGAFVSVSRLGKPTRVGGTSTGPDGWTLARLATCHRSRKGGSVARQKRKEVEASVPARIKSSGFVPVRRVKLQKSAGDVWPRISSAHALQKERSGSSERGPSSARRPAGETVGRCVERRDSRGSGSSAQVG